MNVKAAIATLVLLIVSFIFFFISFVAPVWYDSYDTKQRRYFGLWKVCVYMKESGETNCQDIINLDIPDWHLASCAMMTLALPLLTASLILAIGFLFIPAIKGKKKVMLGCCLTAFFSSLIIFIAVVIFAAMEDFLVYHRGAKIGWAYGLAVVANVLSLISSGVAFVQYRVTYEF